MSVFLCLTPVIGLVLQTRVHSTQYTADTVHSAAVAGREQWKAITGSLATLLCHYHITFVTSLSQNIQLSLFAGNLRLRACLAPPPWLMSVSPGDSGSCRRSPDTLSLSSPSQFQSSESDIRRLLHGDLQQPAAGVQRGAGTCSQGAAACSSAYTGLIQLQGASTELQKSAWTQTLQEAGVQFRVKGTIATAEYSDTWTWP